MSDDWECVAGSCSKKAEKIRCTVEKRAVPLHTMTVLILNSLMFYFCVSDSSTCTGPWSSSLPITRSMVAMSTQEICSLQAPSVDLWVSTCTTCLGLDDCDVYPFVCQFSVCRLDYITSLSKFSCGFFTLRVVAFPLSLTGLCHGRIQRALAPCLSCRGTDLRTLTWEEKELEPSWMMEMKSLYQVGLFKTYAFHFISFGFMWQYFRSSNNSFTSLHNANMDIKIRLTTVDKTQGLKNITACWYTVGLSMCFRHFQINSYLNFAAEVWTCWTLWKESVQFQSVFQYFIIIVKNK